ncbi:MAG: hypothetical protein M3270_00230 [Thermoproteota archaeon]|nr:hypothetical protein [Thermoproteota archaeon]
MTRKKAITTTRIITSNGTTIVTAGGMFFVSSLVDEPFLIDSQYLDVLTIFKEFSY